jgi:hypothetical protein
MVKRRSMKKDAYWHNIAKLGISSGLKPAQVGRLVKEVFPDTEVNGRHIGAYKRRIVDETGIEIPTRPTTTLQEMMGIVKDLVSDEDEFAYTCAIGSTKRSLKCFEYKLTAELKDKDNMENIDEWINTLQ